MSSQFPKTKGELLAYLAKPTPHEYISHIEFKNLIRWSKFKCPKPRQRINLCDGKVCPRRPHPCDKCTPIKSWNKVFRSKADDTIKDSAFKILISNCEKCMLITPYLEDPDYFHECSRSRSARNRLDGVNEGRIIVKSSGWGITH